VNSARSITSALIGRLGFRTVRSRAALLGVIMLAGLSVAVNFTVPALAQSPSPNATFLDWAPSTYNTSTTGTVVEGLGMGACSYSLSSAESETVKYINNSKPVITEISPQSGCDSLSAYESLITSLTNYVSAHASKASTWWGGVMLDEEPNFGFTVSNLESLNNFTENEVTGTIGGLAYLFTEDATWSGAWDQAQWNAIVNIGEPTPQVYNSYMVGIANNDPLGYNLVTYNPSAGSPFNSESYTVGQVHGGPYFNTFGSSSSWYWVNKWQSQ
jgi:hypothetical protein